MYVMGDEAEELSDYGHFIDIDNGAVLYKSILEKSEYHCVEKTKHSVFNTSKLNETSKTSIFCMNTFCCVAVSILFLKVWIFPSK